MVAATANQESGGRTRAKVGRQAQTGAGRPYVRTFDVCDAYTSSYTGCRGSIEQYLGRQAST